MAKKVRLQRFDGYIVRDQDPVIKEVREIFDEQLGGVTGRDLRHTEAAGGPSAGAMRAWFSGKTKRPQNASVEAAGRALGRKRVWVSHRPNR